MFGIRKNHSFTLTRYVLVIAVFWTVAIIVSLVWNLIQINRTTIEIAINEARAAYAKDVVYRSWNAQHGGVYVRITEKTPPNPYLKHPERDLTTLSGIRLTLINPAYMTRQVHELGEKKLGIRAHITSIKPIRPENAADPWETAALKAFDRGESEVSSSEIMDGKEYLRLMRPLITEESCLKCHAKQGYKIGDIRGGISVSIPMQPIRAIAVRNIFILVMAHCILWLLGTVGIGYGTKRIKQNITKRKRVEEKLLESERRYRAFVQNFLGIAFQGDMNFVPIFFHGAVEQITGYTEDEFKVGKPRWDQVIHPDDLPPIISEVSEKLTVIPNYSSERIYRIIRKDRHIRWVNEFIQNICDDSGKLTFVQGAIYDITERKKAEEELAKYRGHLEKLVEKRTIGLKKSNESLRDEISERKRAEEILKESEEKYRKLIESASDAIFIADVETGKIIEVNKKAEELLGLPAKKIIGMHQSQLHPHEEKKYYSKRFQQAIKQEEPLGKETFVVHKDGHKIPVEISASFPTVGGKKIAQGIFRDITERKKAEEALRESEERYRSLVENINLGIVLMDPDYNVVMANAALGKILKRDVNKIIGGKCYREFEKNDSVCPECLGKQSMRTRLPQEVETEAVLKDGAKIPLWVRNFPVFGSDGKATGFIEVVEDITERKIAEEQLRKLSHAIEQSPTTIMITDAAGDIEYVNPKFTELTGYSADEVLGKNPSFLNAGKQPSEFYNQLWDTIQCGETWHGEFLNKKKNGELYWEYASISPVIDKEDSITHYVAIKEDITERKRVEEELTKHREHLQDLIEERTAELKQTHRQLLHAEKLSAIGKLSASIAHEFNNPIFGIRNVLEGIKNRFPLKKLDKEEVNLAISECNRIKNLIFSMQSFHKPTSGRMAYLDIHKALDEMLLLCKKQLHENNIKVQKKYAAHMPKIRVVEDQIKQVVLNLLTNAMEAIPQKGGTIKIKTRASARKVAIQIQDSGLGIKAKDKDKIFEPFFSTKPAVKGAGLGLSVSYGIIKTHGGDIGFKSQPGKGTIFIVTLPIIKAI